MKKIIIAYHLFQCVTSIESQNESSSNSDISEVHQELRKKLIVRSYKE